VGGVVAPRRERLTVADFLALPRAECAAGLVMAILNERADDR
jgi:hypothetical protein